ncbi:MAG: hypothetical protein IT193_01780 [Propionibacteriaceae bacterium]|nr:hypothetical protein [Propionibacteriaceae bacterium]
MRVVRYLLERLTALDLNLMGRFAARERDRSLSWRTAQRHIFGPVGTTLAANRETERTSVCLGGLEVEQFANNAATLTITAGAMLGTHPAPVTETRPGTWSGREEADDYARAMFILPFAATIAPSVPLTVATTDVEWWVVYVTPTVQAVETDSQRRVFNEGTGVFDSASATKVERYKAVPGALRGTPGGAIPDPPAGGIPIAWVRVPAGATNLNDALVFDVRRLLHDAPGPNRIGGCWQFSHEGQLSGTYNQTVFLGRVHARLSGELLGARAYTSLIQVGDLAEPGATWDAGAAPATPKIAWLYLTKVKGLVPRPVRRGQSPIGHHGTFTGENVLIDGGMVLSPTPPRIGASTDASKAAKSGLRWDMRPSAALTLPSFSRGDVPHSYAGIVVQPEDAICVGFYRYTGVDGVPLLVGSLHVDEKGWMKGSSIATYPGAGTDEDGLFTVPTFNANNAAAPRTLTSDILYGPAQITIGGTDYPLPLDAARLLVFLASSAATPAVLGTREDAGRVWALNGSSQAYAEIERRQVTPGRPYFNEIQFTVDTSTWVSSGSIAYLVAVRLPYGEDLVT